MHITSDSHAQSNRVDISISANDHEEADNRICLRVDDALIEGATTILARTVGTDLVVILFGIFHDLGQLHPEMQLWAGFGIRNHFRYYHIN